MGSKFKIKFKVEKLELEIEGNREDVPLITQALGQQVSGLLAPASDIVQGEITENYDLPQLSSEEKPKTRRKSSIRQPSQKSTSSISNVKSKETAVDWKHNSSKWGNPQQSWSTIKKSIWLLYVVLKETAISEISGRMISATFNKHFRQSGEIRTGQINRDLGKAKGEKPALISENTIKTPSAWYLTIEGEKRAKALISEALGKIQSN